VRCGARGFGAEVDDVRAVVVGFNGCAESEFLPGSEWDSGLQRAVSGEA